MLLPLVLELLAKVCRGLPALLSYAFDRARRAAPRQPGRGTPRAHSGHDGSSSTHPHSAFIIAVLLLLIPIRANAQQQGSSAIEEFPPVLAAHLFDSMPRTDPGELLRALPASPSPLIRPAGRRARWNEHPGHVNNAYASFPCGIGATTSTVATKATTGCGLAFSLFPGAAVMEVGVMGPQANRSYLTGYVSLDSNIPLAPFKTRYYPTALVATAGSLKPAMPSTTACH